MLLTLGIIAHAGWCFSLNCSSRLLHTPHCSSLGLSSAPTKSKDIQNMHAYRHSCCLVRIQMIWKAEQDAQCSHLMSPVPLCMSCQVLLSVLEEGWLSLRSNMVGPLVWISNEKPVGCVWTESSHLVLREPTALRGSFVYWSSEGEWRRLKLWALRPLGSFFFICLGVCFDVLSDGLTFLIILYLSINIHVNQQYSGKFQVAVGNCGIEDEALANSWIIIIIAH